MHQSTKPRPTTGVGVQPLVIRSTRPPSWSRCSKLGGNIDHRLIGMPKIHIEVQNQFGRWQHVQTMHNEANAYRTAQQRARSTDKRYRLVDDDGHLLDVIDP